MSYYITDFNKIRQDKSILKILEALERGFERFGIDFYLIGAVAREVWMTGLKNIIPRRATTDIDFAVLMKDSADFAAFKSYLLEVEGFSAYSGNAFVVIAPGGRQIDILPFGEIEKEGKVTVTGTGMTTIYVDGMKEVYEEGIPSFTFEEKITFKVCTLPGIVLLKLIAWDDRPEMRLGDLTDIADILYHFFNIYDEMIWAAHNDLFDDQQELITISARVLGRQMGKILRRNPALNQRIMNLLPASGLAKATEIATIMATSLDQTIDQTTALLSAIEAGIMDVVKN
jgi:predicted nucleotidyltransferase